MLKIIKKLFIVAFIALALPVFAEEEAIFSFDDFSGGLNSHTSPYNVKDRQGVTCQNMRVNDQYGSLSKRDPVVLLLDGGTAAIDGMHRFYKSDLTEKTVFATGGGLYYDASGTATALETGFTTGEAWQFATYMDKVIGWNGTDLPVKWDGKTTVTADTDGSRTAGSLCTQLGAPFAELNTGTDLTAAKWYQYKITFIGSSVSYYTTARSNPILTGANVRNIYLTDVPLGPAGTTARYIYRTAGAANKTAVLADTTYKYCGVISDNSTKVFADSMSDATLAGQAAWSSSGLYNATPPAAKLGTVHRDRLFMARTANEPSYLFWSDDFNPDFFDPSEGYEPIREDDGGKISFIKEFRGTLTVGKETAIQNFYTDSADPAAWHSSTPFSFVGCVSPYSAAVTTMGIAYLSGSGIWRYTGQSSIKMSDAVTRDIQDISPVDADNAVGFYFDDNYYLAYTSISGGRGYNDMVLIYNFTRDSYVKDFKNVNCFMEFNAGSDFNSLYTGSSDTTGYIYAQEYSPNILTLRYKADFDAGTYDDVRVKDTDPLTLELGWDCTVDGWLAELQTKDASISSIDTIGTYLPNAIIDRPDTNGTWTSPVYQVDASSLTKLYWREDLGAVGDITWQVRLAATEASCATATWSTAVTDPSGSDLTGITANNYLQLRANLSTTDIDYSPYLEENGGYAVRLVYDKAGSVIESNFTSQWDSGWKNFSNPSWKMLKRIRVFYTGTSGTINVRYYNDDYDIDNNFDIDLSILPEASTTDDYGGVNEEKIFTYYCPANEEGASPIGRMWRFVVSNTDINKFQIQKIEVKYSPSKEID